MGLVRSAVDIGRRICAAMANMVDSPDGMDGMPLTVFYVRWRGEVWS